MQPRKGEEPKNAPAKIDRLEWCFDDCPRDELFDCWLYEFARELGWLREFVAIQKAKKLEELAHEAAFYSFLLFPQWPSEPYLSVSEEERHSCMALVRPKTEQEILANSLVPRQLPKGTRKALADSLRASGRPRIHSKDSLVELALLRIHWSRPDSVLIDAFKAYIKQFRPLDPYSPIRHTGRKEPDSKRRMQLRQLGMFRLIRANQDNCHATHTAFCYEFGKDGVPLKKADAWYRAQAKSEALIKEVGAEFRRRLEEAHEFLF
jgi:hypothetical protein